MRRAIKTRAEKDTMGVIQVPIDRLWGAQTQRSLENFRIGSELMPMQMIKALAIIKKAAAIVNRDHYNLPSEIGSAIEEAADEIISGTVGDENFPLVVWQTGSGTQTNMNVNEVIANRVNTLNKHGLGDALKISSDTKVCHPNDHVNMHQSSNDTIPTAMHIAIILEAKRTLIPGVESLLSALEIKSKEWASDAKIGRTHLQDAVPITFGQEFSGYARQVECCRHRIEQAMEPLYELAQGGTAVGTGLNAPSMFDSRIAEKIASLTGEKFRTGKNKYSLIAAHDSIVDFHSALNALAVGLFKIANDVRLAGSGPRCGLGELILPANEPGSSIMPGKVNPTQCEAVTQVCAQVFGNNVTVGFAGSQGHFELNAYKPVIGYNTLQSLRLLGEVCASFASKCISGLEIDRVRVQKTMEKSLMLVTALSPHIGYEKAASIAKCAHEQGITLREAAIKLQLVSETDFDSWINVNEMLGPQSNYGGKN